MTSRDMGRIVIVGLGAAGFSAVMAAKKTDRKAEITVVDEKSYDLMHPCGLPFAIEGVIDTFDKLKHALSLEKMKVEHVKPFRVTGVDADAGSLKARSESGGEEIDIGYDRLIIATGARPSIPPVPGLADFAGRGVFTVSTPDDACAIRDAATCGGTALCIGAGAIGLETAVALKRCGMDVIVAELLPSVMPRALDPDMASVVQSYLEEEGMDVRCGAGVEEVRGDGAVREAVTGGETIETGLVVAAAGVRANTDVARAAGADIGETGIVVDNRMKTTVEGIYAAGDCAQTRSVIDGEPFTLQLSTTAWAQASVAGVNAAGGEARYPGVAGAFISKVGRLEVAAVGYTSEYAKTLGYETVFGKIRDNTLYDWYPGGTEITVKVIADKKSGRVLGAQAVGESGAAARVNVASTAIAAGMDLDGMSRLELAYCPAVSQAYDPLIKAVDFALRKKR